MPIKPKRPCNRCKRLTDNLYCPECEKIVLAKKDAERETSYARGYDARWRKVRILKLKRTPLCEQCNLHGFIVRAVLVHHKDRNPRNLSDENLESLCRNCHDIEHKDEFFKKKEQNA